jgi:hypothetical protein
MRAAMNTLKKEGGPEKHAKKRDWLKGPACPGQADAARVNVCEQKTEAQSHNLIQRTGKE